MTPIAGARPIPGHAMDLGDSILNDSSGGGPKIHAPGEIAQRVGNITVKTLSALIRARGTTQAPFHALGSMSDPMAEQHTEVGLRGPTNRRA